MTDMQSPSAEPALRSVALYKHGVAAFHWSAEVGSDGALVIPVPAQQIDDVLKSLLVLAPDGGDVASIAYTADEPLQRQLGNFGVNLQDVTGFADLLNRMTGFTIRFRRGSETLQGQIIATEVVDRQSGDQVVRDEWLVILLEGGSIERVELNAVRGLEVILGETPSRLGAQLDLLRIAKQPDVSRLVLTAKPGTAIDLFYVAEAPVWKMTYRAVLPADAEDKPFLQGWAIAENTSATDWSGVDLALISGMPLSFTLDLRHPRFRTRPTATIPEIDAIAPPVSEAAFLPVAAPAAASYAGEGMQVMDYAVEEVPVEERARGISMPQARNARGARAMKTMLAQTPPPPTTTRAVGELFEYRIDHPVTIPAQQAALIPVVAATLEGGPVSVYNAAVHADHPLNAIRLRNSTSLTLDAGPITVLRDETYVGEAIVDVIKPGEERLVSYAVDLGCRVESQHDSGEGVMTRVRVRRGVLHYDRRETATTTYRFTNVTDDPRTIIVEHPIRAGWDTPEPPPIETTASYRRYEVAVASNAGAQLVVREGRTLEESIALLNGGPDQIMWIISQTGNHPDVAPVLRRLVEQFRAVAARQEAVNRIQRDIDALMADQGRLRSNLQALGQGPEERELARRYVAELGRSEDRMAELRAALLQAQQEVEQATSALHALIDEMELDQPLSSPAQNNAST